MQISEDELQANKYNNR